MLFAAGTVVYIFFRCCVKLYALQGKKLLLQSNVLHDDKGEGTLFLLLLPLIQGLHPSEAMILYTWY